MKELRKFQKFTRYQSTSVIPTSSKSWRNAKPFFWSAEPQRRAAKYLGHAWYIGKRFCKSRCVIISTLSPRIASMEFIDRGAAPFIHRQKQDQDLKCQPWPSAKKSVIFSGGDSSKNYGADQQRLQISDLHFDKFPTPATFACWKVRFKTEVCTCSQFPTEAMQWIKEVEMVDSADDVKFSLSTRGISMPNFDVLDARIASALNKIIHNSQFKRRISLEEQKARKQDRFFRGRQIAFLIYDYFRVIGSHDSVENYTDLFTVSLRNDDSWIRFKVGRNSIVHDENPIWWHLGRTGQIENTRVWEAQDRIGIVRPGDSSKEVRTWLSQIESYGEEKYRTRIHEIRILGSEMEILRRTPRSRIREQNSENKEFLEMVGNGKPTGSVWKETIAVSATISTSVVKVTPSNPSPNSFMQQSERKPSRTRSPRGKSPSGRTSRWPCKGYLRGTCNNSFCEKWHPPECWFYKTKSGCRFGEKCSYSHRQVDEQPTKRSKTNNDKSAVAILKKGNWQDREPVTDQRHDRSGQLDKRSDKKLGRRSSQRRSSDARQLGCVFQDMKPPKSILRKCTDMQRPIQRVKFTKAIERHTKIRDQHPSLGYICPGELHERSPSAPKFEDRSQKETEWQEQGAREAAWKLAKMCWN